MKIKSIVLLIMVILFTPLLTFAADVEGYGHAKKGGIGFLFLQLYDHNKSDHRGPIVVIDVFDRGTAIKSSIMKGDIITHIDGIPTKGKDYEYILEEMIRGPAFTDITLTLKRSGEGKAKEITIGRIMIEGYY